MRKVRFRDIDFEMEMSFDIDAYTGSIISLGKTTFAETEGIVAEIPKLGFTVAPADVYQKYTDGEWRRDWSGTFLYESGHTPEEYAYYEQGDIRSAVRNYLNSCGRGGELTDDLECIIKPEKEAEDGHNRAD